MSTMHEPPRTYLVAPNFTTKPGGAIKLGNVLANPLLPHRPIAFLEEEKCPEVEDAFDTNLAIHRTTDVQANLSVATKILQVVGIGAGIDKSCHIAKEYTMEMLKTEAFSGLLPHDTIVELVGYENVKRIMKPPRWSRSVYVVSGIKTARSFRFKRAVNTHTGANVEASAKPAQEVETAEHAAVSKSTTESDDIRSAQDIVLAYQLFEISSSILLGTTQGEYDPGQRGEFLGADSPDEDENVEGEDPEFDCAFFTEDDLSKVLGESRTAQEVQFREEDRGNSCILEDDNSF